MLVTLERIKDDRAEYSSLQVTRKLCLTPYI